MSDRDRPTIGFIGLGIMGRPMARNLLAAGFPLTVLDHKPAVMAELAAEGAGTAPTPQEVALACDVLITMLPDSPQVREVYLSPNGALEAARPDWLAIDMSSIAPATAREVAEQAAAMGAAMLDAPVSGGEPGAVAGTLSIMVGGDADAVARARPIFDVLGTTIVHVGPAGAGQVVKACNQVVVGVVIEAVAEALLLGARAGVDPALIADVLQGGLAATRVLELRREKFLTGAYEPGFRLRLHLKDLRNALALAGEAGVPVPAAVTVEQLMATAVAEGRGELDHTALLAVLEDLADDGAAHDHGA
jgi:2-hydroxy-3-oxopropionate reductase